jgi:hypothetical protein
MVDISIIDRCTSSYYSNVLARRQNSSGSYQFLAIALEKIPTENDNDYFINVHIDQVDIVVNLKLLQRIGKLSLLLYIYNCVISEFLIV